MADLSSVLAELLEAVADNLVDPPDRQYVADGLPAFDCSQLTVHLGPITRGTAERERPAFQCAPTTVTAIVTRTWCIPTLDDRGNPPKPSALDASGRDVTDGAIELWHAVSTAAREVSCRPSLELAAPVEPSGGYVGWAVTVRFVL